jgi:hypothetical protein
MRRHTSRLVPEAESEVVALGRSFGVHSMGLNKKSEAGGAQERPAS